MRRIFFCLTLIFSLLVGATVVTTTSYALDKKAEQGFRAGLFEAGGIDPDECKDAGGTVKDNSCVDKDGKPIDSVSKMLQSIINLLLFISGILAVILIVVGGFRYVTSNGDSGAASKAKNTIIYAAIGLVIAIMAYAIVNFILDNIR